MAFLVPENLRSLRDLPAGVRRLAAALATGLDDAVTCWYEPAWDPEGGRPDFVVLDPDRGLAVLQVVDDPAADPLLPARRLADALRARLQGARRLARPIPVGVGAVLAGRGGGGEGPGSVVVIGPEDVREAAGGDGAAGLLRALGRITAPGLEESLTEDEVALVRGLIHPGAVIDRPVAGAEQLAIFRPPEDPGELIRVMDRRQEALAKGLGEGHRVIRGVAGSGKTLVLVYRAELLGRAMPRERILLGCYTRSLAGQLRDRLREVPNVEVRHLDGLMQDLIAAAGLPSPGYEDDRSGTAVARTALAAIAAGAGPRYRAVLLDEAQDFSTEALRVAAALLEPPSMDLVVVADAAQNIFRRDFSWRQAGIQAQGRTRVLRVNYRNTQEILAFAQDALLDGEAAPPDDVDEHAIIPPEAAERSGPAPEVCVAADERAEVDAVVGRVGRWVAEHGPVPRGVAVLYGSRHAAGFDRGAAIRDGLAGGGIGAFWLTDPSDPGARDRLAARREPVVLSTVHSAKGLEFPRVALCAIPPAESGGRALAYVGMTRAMDELFVVTLPHGWLAGAAGARSGA